MDRIEIYQEIRSMQIAYIFHFVFYIILGIEHLLMILKIFWNNVNLIKIFISCSIIDLIALFYPIIPLVLMYRIILRKNLIKGFKFISLNIIILSFIIGILINISFWLNLKETTNFSKECPYNLNDTRLFINYEDTSKRCSERRCILESINEFDGYPYNYICNYNSQNEFEIDPNKQYPIKSSDGSIYYLKYFIQCEKKTYIEELFVDKNNINEQNDIYIYLKKCWNNNDIQGFYLCQRYEYPKNFKINDKYECPKDNYNVILYLCGIFLIILDIIFAFIPWSLDYKSYSKIILFYHENEDLVLDNNFQQRERHNETNTSSNNQNLNNYDRNNNQNLNGNNNIQNNEVPENEGNNVNNFIHQPTETIIIVKNNSSSNYKSSDRLNSGLNSNNSKSNVNNNKNYKKVKENINSMISKSESDNMISKSSEKENESEDSKIKDKNKLILNRNDEKNNEIDDINFNNDIKYDEYKNNDEEDEKVEDKKVKYNCLIQNKKRNIYKNILNNNMKKLIALTNEDNSNINIKETNNSVRTTIAQKNKEENIEKTKNDDNLENYKDFEQFIQINENINTNYKNKTPKKDLKSLNFNFSQVLTNIRDSEQNSSFNNTNGSIIKEEKKEETERTYKEEEKNNNNLSSVNEKKNLSEQASKIENKSKENQTYDKKMNYINKLKNDSQNSLLIDNSNKSNCHLQLKKNENN